MKNTYISGARTRVKSKMAEIEELLDVNSLFLLCLSARSDTKPAGVHVPKFRILTLI